MDKLCKDCVHCEKWIGEYAIYRLCRHPQAPSENGKGHNNVVGDYSFFDHEGFGRAACGNMRTKGECGPEGKWWEPKPPSFWKRMFG